MSRKDYEFTFLTDDGRPKATGSVRDRADRDLTVPNLQVLDVHSFPGKVQPPEPEPVPRSRLAELRRLSEFIKLQRKLEALKAKDDKTR